VVTDALKNMKQRQSGHAVKGPAYGCSHIIFLLQKFWVRGESSMLVPTKVVIAWTSKQVHNTREERSVSILISLFS
jgi:hypothetical protein